MKHFSTLGQWALAALIALTGLISSQALADPVVHRLTLSGVNYTSAGVAGIGDVGEADITISGIDGTVVRAYLYWHGVGLSGTVYDNPTVEFNGTAVTGELIGRAGTNCWGAGESRAYRADVTALITGDGLYTIEGMTSAPNDDVNGASLIVVFDDGDPSTGRDLAFFEGNDSSHAEGFPTATNNWDALLTPINYGGGDVFAQLHVGDGQSFNAGTIRFTTANGSLDFVSGTSTYLAGNSLPTMGNSRAGNGELWDIHTLDITDAFGGVPDADASLNLTLQQSQDCVALIAVVMDLEAGSAPPGLEDPQDPPPPPPPEEPALPVPVNSPLGLGLLLLLMLAIAGWQLRRNRAA